MTENTTFLIVGMILLITTVLVVTVVWLFFKMSKKLVSTSDFPRIAEEWPAFTTPPGTTFSRQNIALNTVWYKNCANVIIAEEGLYISLGFPVSLSTIRAVIIPWRNIRYLKKSCVFWTDVQEY